MSNELLVTLLLVLPIAGFLVTLAAGPRLNRVPWLFAVPGVIATWAIGMLVVFRALAGELGAEGLHFTLYRWIPAGTFTLDVNFAVDNLTAVLLIVVTTVGMLVHVYSIGYMEHDPGRWRFFAFLNLFMFSMLLLVLAANFLVLFVAWELVGLSSYLLIGFWYRKRSAALAAKKAFLVNRVGDLGFILGILAIWTTVGSLNFSDVFRVIPEKVASGEIAPWMVTGIALLLFLGAVGKSAQFPLHVWLPDAMEGPTPVSALIHAATMVNAGVYMVARTNPIFTQSPEAMLVVAAIGIFTALLAASIALTQTDIKRVLAYSTLSQLGYMFAALGVGAYGAAIFHLLAHGFFKGLLFLDSGAVIHAVNGEQDMNRMGGLWRKLPVVHWTMLVGSIAIAGIPPLAGFFSKDQILGESFKFGFYWVWAVGLIVAGMTAFYMFRLMGKTFYGPSHVDPHVAEHIHRPPHSMAIPLVLLAIPSALLGLAVGWPPENGLIAGWLRPIFEGAEETLGRHVVPYEAFGIDGGLALASVTIAALGVVVAMRLFGFRLPGRDVEPRPGAVERATTSLRPLYVASFHKFWFDDLNHLLFYRFGGAVARGAWWFDANIVDGAVNAVGSVTSRTGRRLGHIQTGRVQNYALGIALGLIAMTAGFLAVALR
jgi:NADH-quinone oxidoreductase subunit L